MTKIDLSQAHSMHQADSIERGSLGAVDGVQMTVHGQPIDKIDGIYFENIKIMFRDGMNELQSRVKAAFDGYGETTAKGFAEIAEREQAVDAKVAELEDQNQLLAERIHAIENGTILLIAYILSTESNERKEDVKEVLNKFMLRLRGGPETIVLYDDESANTTPSDKV